MRLCCATQGLCVPWLSLEEGRRREAWGLELAWAVVLSWGWGLGRGAIEVSREKGACSPGSRVWDWPCPLSLGGAERTLCSSL